jgi:hypothetical protein
MQLLDKVRTNINACGIELAFGGVSVPSIIAGWQPFYNSIMENAEFHKVGVSISSVDYAQESVTSKAGVSYRQKVTFRFPNGDPSRADRIALMQKITMVNIKLSDGRLLTIGRNDFNQNTKPTIKTTENSKVCEVEIESSSIFPTGYTPSYDQFGLPVFIPLSF